MKGLRKEARREWRKDLFGGLGMSGLGPPQLARITSRTDDTLPLASAAAREHLCQNKMEQCTEGIILERNY